MTTERKQSDINEVRDQLSLDFADGEYLNVISRNLGMDRPVLGFTEDSWRAVVKILALEYKQISNKFRDVLEVIFGPRVTEVGTLSEAVALGDAEFVLNDTSNFPQLGTVIFDEGLLTEETRAYCYIDRETNTVFLEESFGAAHIAREFDSEEPLVAVSPANELVFLKTNNFPTTDYTYPIVLGRGTANEEVVQVTSNDTSTATLTLSGAPANSHAALRVGDIFDQLNQQYFPRSSFLLLEDSTFFPESGYLKLAASGDATTPTPVAFALSANTPLTSDVFITLAASTFVTNSLVGFEIVFTGNNTAALAGRTRRIISNTDAVITLDENFTVEGAAPVTGDEFTLFPIVQYTSLDYSSHTVTLRKPILEPNITIPLNSTVELMVVEETAALSPVKFVGTGWDIIQTTPRLVELLIPEDIRDDNDLRSSSHIHDDSLGAISTTNSVQVDPLDTEVIAVSFASFPDAGTVEFDPGGGSAERIAYGKAISEIKTYAAAGAGTLVLVNSKSFPATGSVIVSPGTSSEETLAFSANNTSSGTLTLTGTTTYEHRVGEAVECTTLLLLQSGAVNTHVIGTTIEFYNPQYSSTTVPIGDFNQFVDTWPGPYVYSLDERAATATVAVTNATTIVPGATFLTIGQSAGRSSLEIEGAIPMLEGLTLPTPVLVGAGTSREELVQIDEIAIKGRASTTLAANSLIGDTVIQLTTLVPGPTSDGATFPNNDGYRIVIDEAVAADREVAYVVGTTTVVDATAAIGAGVNGTVNITAVGGLAGVAGNSATVTVVDPTPTNGPLSAVAVGGVLTVTLAVAAGVLDTAANTATLIAAAISLLDDFSAAASGTGGDSIAAPEGPTSFTGGIDGLTLEAPLTIAHTSADTVDLMSDVLSATFSLTKSHNGVISVNDRSTALVGSAAYFVVADATALREVVLPQLDSITLVSATGLDIDGGNVIFNFGNGQILAESTLTAPLAANDTAVPLVSSDDFPSPTSPFVAIIGVGTPNEEKVLVTANNTGTDIFTLDTATYGVQYAHATGETVRFEPGVPEDVEFSEVDGSDLRFDPDIMLQYTHYPVETVIDSSATSDPRDNGYDFPLRMPIDILVRLQYLLDIVRAAGVQVELITQR